MIWWVLTYLDNYRPAFSLTVLAETNLAAHLFMKWSRFKPARRPVYKRVRAVNVWCGYEYIWDTPNLVEQNQAGITFEHTFDVEGLADTDHVWYYLFSIGERPFKECQGPLIHVPPPEITMASARIFNQNDLAIPHNTITPVSFDSVMWDDYNFYDPAEPTRLTIPAGALYHVGCCLRFENAIDPGARVWIRLNEGLAIVMHSHPQIGLDWGGCAFSLSTDMRLQPADFLEVCVLHLGGGPRKILAFDHFSPHFWIRQVGAYPV